MIIKYSTYKKDEHSPVKEGFFISETKDNIKMSKTGKAYNILITDTAQIKLVGKDGKEITVTGKELINKLF